MAFRYEVSLKGQASKLDFRLDKTELDFGEVPYTEAGSSSRSGLAVHVCAYIFFYLAVSFNIFSSPGASLVHLVSCASFGGLVRSARCRKER